MGLRDWRERRRATSEYGEGVWRLTADRLGRGLRSFEKMAAASAEGAARDELEDAFGLLTDAVADARLACAAAHAVAPSSSTDVPAGPRGVHPGIHNRLTRIGADIAAAAEGAALVRAGDASASGRVHRRAVRLRAEAADVRALAQAQQVDAPQGA